MSILKPTALRTRCGEVTPALLRSLGVRAVLLDVDNTIAAQVRAHHIGKHLVADDITAEEAYLLQDFRYEEAASYSAKNCKVTGFKDFKETLVELLEKHGAEYNILTVVTRQVAEDIKEIYRLSADPISYNQFLLNQFLLIDFL